MFSDNHKISGRQLKTLLMIDWLGKTVLLIPQLTRGVGSRNTLLAAVAGMVLAAVMAAGLAAFSEKISGNYYLHVQKRMGNAAAFVLYLVYGIYFFLHTAVMLHLCGGIAAAYLLPDTDLSILMLPPLAVGYFLAKGGLEVRGRVSELLSGVILVVVFLMLGNSLLQIQPERLWYPEQLDGYVLAENSYLTAAGFGSMFSLPFVLPEVEKGTGWKRRLYVPLAVNGIFLILIYLAGFGIFGAEGMERLDWPIISLMSSINLQGVFLQRWDILFIGLLLLSLFFAVGSGIYYIETIVFTLQSGGIKKKLPEEGCSNWKKRRIEKKRRVIRLSALLIVYLTMLNVEHWETVIGWYNRIGLMVCIPVLAVMTILIWGRGWMMEKGNGAGEKKAEEQE